MKKFGMVTTDNWSGAISIEPEFTSFTEKIISMSPEELERSYLNL